MSGPLEGRVAIVTGASRGIGEAIARGFAAAGAAVAVTARTVHEGDHVLSGSIEATVASITSAGGRALAIPADLSLHADRERVVTETEAQLGPVDVLVNNAAVTYWEPVTTFNPRHYELMFEVQVRAPFALAQLLLPGMRERGRGWILNISSSAAKHPEGPPYQPLPVGDVRTVYGMCKAALERFSTGLASEVYSDGIAVNALSPSGVVLTPGMLHHRLDEVVPLEGREPVDHMVNAALRLCTGDPAALTGRVTSARPLLEEQEALPA